MKIFAVLVIESVLGLNKPDAHKFLRSIIITVIGQLQALPDKRLLGAYSGISRLTYPLQAPEKRL